MTIEVRQLLIKSQVTSRSAEPQQEAQAQIRAQQNAQQIKQAVMAECKLWLAERLQELKER